jgi:hypothetical protein
MGDLSNRELLALLRGGNGLNIVGGDVVEVSSACAHAEMTILAAATVAYDLVSLLANGRSTMVKARLSPPQAAVRRHLEVIACQGGLLPSERSSGRRAELPKMLPVLPTVGDRVRRQQSPQVVGAPPRARPPP